MAGRSLFSNLRQRLMPRSLRWQFTLAVGGLALLILASGATAVYALRGATSTTRALVDERMVRMQEAQDLVQRTLLIERESYQLAGAASVNAMRGSFAGITLQLEAFDRLVDRLAADGGGGDIAVLELHQASQLFRNTVSVVAQLQESELQRGSQPGHAAARRGGDRSVQQYHDELRRQASAMVVSARAQSDRFTNDFLAAMQELTQSSTRNQRWVSLLLVGSLLLAWLLAHILLGKHVLDRLHQVSLRLRQGNGSAASSAIPVQGNDEIGEMARAVEQFQNDRRQLAQRTAQLEAVNKELEGFLYSVSHDLRVPLRAIDGFAHLLQDDYADKLDDEGRRLIGVVRGNAQRMAQLIDDILKFSRTGQVPLAFSAVDMERVAREAFAGLGAADAGLQFEVGPLPPARGDEALLRQVFGNLLSNAIKFSRPRAAPRVKVGGFVAGEEAVYYVKDNGVGFDMQYADKLFGVFQRLHKVEEFTGTGIGLAIVKRIVSRHGGRVWAESRLDEGATLYFSLPRAQQ